MACGHQGCATTQPFSVSFHSDDHAAPAASDLLALLRLWRERWRQRRTLATLTDEQLDDIGVSRAEAAREAAKPFWR